MYLLCDLNDHGESAGREEVPVSEGVPLPRSSTVEPVYCMQQSYQITL